MLQLETKQETKQEIKINNIKRIPVHKKKGNSKIMSFDTTKCGTIYVRTFEHSEEFGTHSKNTEVFTSVCLLSAYICIVDLRLLNLIKYQF